MSKADPRGDVVMTPIRWTCSVFAVMLLANLLPGAAAAQDQRFAVRFGINLVEPTGQSTSMGQTSELDSQTGGEIGFEFYANRRLGLEVSMSGSASTDVQTSGLVVASVTFSSFLVGLNWHVVNTENVDWSLGVLAGRAGYGNFEVTSGITTIQIQDDTTYGVQTSVDLPITKGGHWAINVGVKYLVTSLKLEGGQDIDFDPVILRVMGVYRFGTGK